MKYVSSKSPGYEESYILHASIDQQRKICLDTYEYKTSTKKINKCLWNSYKKKDISMDLFHSLSSLINSKHSSNCPILGFGLSLWIYGWSMCIFVVFVALNTYKIRRYSPCQYTHHRPGSFGSGNSKAQTGKHGKIHYIFGIIPCLRSRIRFWCYANETCYKTSKWQRRHKQSQFTWIKYCIINTKIHQISGTRNCQTDEC